MVLLGVSLHNLWPRSAPRCIRRQAPAAEGEGPPNVDGPQTEDAWHALHSFRVRKTFDFFQRGNLVCTLVLLLQSMQPAYVCMAWMMKHLGVDAACNPDEPGTALPVDRKLKPDVLVHFVHPDTSPVLAAVVHGTRLVVDRGQWPALWAFNRGPESDLIREIWQAVLPTLSTLAVRVLDMLRGWPLRLVLLLGPDSALADVVAKEFSSTCMCCLPRGLHSLRAKVSNAGDCKTRWFTAVVKENLGSCRLISNH